MKKIFFLSLFVMLSAVVTAKDITGRVTAIDDTGARTPSVGTVVLWLDADYNTLTQGATTTDIDGAFTIKYYSEARYITASFVGFSSDTIPYDKQKVIDITIKPSSLEIDEVIVVNRKSNSLSAISMEKKEMITYAGLCKMACCNIAESFENSASVTVGYSDAVSGARQIKMLGYAGLYTQMLDETRPIARGLDATYGLEHTPGMWLQGIQISKGVTSVVNGYEAMTGQINLEHRKPTDETPLFVNLFLSSELRTEVNISTSQQINEKLSTVILAHASQDQTKMDHNNDGFLDMPLKKQMSIANRWLYQSDNGSQYRFGVKVLSEDRDGGETAFTSDNKGTLEHYGSGIYNKHFNTYLKAGFPIVKNKLEMGDEGYYDETTSNIAIVADFAHHEQDAFFGIKEYNGIQNSAYANILYQLNIGETHQFIAGATITADSYNELLVDRYTTSGDQESGYGVAEKSYNLDRELTTIGIFGEYTLKIGDKFALVAGVRGDDNSEYGFMFTPRGHIKYDISPSTTLRASAGVGYRIMSPITDNIGILATGRAITFADDLNLLERGFTAGGAITQMFTLFGDNNTSITLDYFRSEFTNQVVVDQESSTNEILLYNLNGDSYTDTYQIDFATEPFERFNIFATYRYNDTRITYAEGAAVETPLIDRFKGLVNIQYATNYDKWIFDITAQLNGQMRLPSQSGIVGEENYSKVYPMFFAQVTKRLKSIDIYCGIENIANYTQEDPIISAGDPFSNQFNSTIIWGPITGRKGYIGIRYTI